MADIETYTATACGDVSQSFEVIRWIVDEIAPENLIAVRLNTADRAFVCAAVDRSEVHQTPAAQAHMCVDSGFRMANANDCCALWEEGENPA